MKIGILIFFAMIMFSEVHAHDNSWFGGITLGNDILFNKDKIAVSPDLNITLVFINLGSSIQYFDSESPRYNVYFGLGLLNLFQAQCGTDFSDIKFRFRSIIPLFTTEMPLTWSDARDGKWYKRLNLQIHYENNTRTPEFSNFGLGISYLIF